MDAEANWPSPADGVVVLRVLCQEDAAAWKAGEDDEQRRWFEMPSPAPMENVVAAIERWRQSWKEDGAERHWGIWRESVLAGGVAIRVRPDGRGNVSYIVFPESRRQGIALRAVRLATEWAFSSLGVTAIVAVVNPANIASMAVAAAAGFVDDGWAEDWEFGETGPMRRLLLPRS